MTTVDPRAADQLLTALRRRRPTVAVLGDLVLDRRCEGTSERLCREGPVPVLDIDHTVDAPGGAGNTAMNLAALGAEVLLVGAVGDDEPGQALAARLEAAGIGTDRLVRLPGRSTAVKSRMVADGQLLLRADSCRSADAEEAAAVATAAVAAIEGADAVVVCDYGLGALAALDRHRVREAARMLVVDARRVGDWASLHADVATPNAAETAELLGAPPPRRGRDRWASEHARDIVHATGARHAIVTLDREGTVLLGEGGARHRTSAHPAPEQNAVGAGDTFVADLALALAAGLGIDDAADVGQAAADAVVESPGTSTCSASRLALSLRGLEGAAARGVETWDDVVRAVEEARAHGRRIVLTNGIFDGLHRGHTSFLAEAASRGGLLVVGVNSDASVRHLRGAPPAVGEKDRAAVVAALAAVDHAFVFDSETAVPLIRSLRPDIYVKGGDYLPGMLAESAAVEECDGRLEMLGYVDGAGRSPDSERCDVPTPGE